jgi:hypothetical protein
MSETDLTPDIDTDDTPPAAPVATRPKNTRYRVRLSHPKDGKRIVFTSISEKRARDHLMRRYPRGTTAYLELPDGSTEHYEPERCDEHGLEAEPWAPFDPDAFQPPEEVSPPGQSEWADTEG